MAAVWLCTLLLLAWAFFSAAVNTGQLGDNVEQYIWSRHMAWGYHKHPPLPTWLMGLAEGLFGPSKWWPMALATLCVVASLWLTAWVVRDLTHFHANARMAQRVTAVAALTWTLLQYFSSGIQLFNHNTVMVMCIAWVAFAALRTHRHGAWWAGVGIGAGLAMLAKYQSLLPLLGIVAAMSVSGRLHNRTHNHTLWQGLAAAVALALLIFLPHLVWLIENDFVTLRYASGSVASPGLLDRLQSVVSFIANQIRNAFPLILALLLYKGFSWMRPGTSTGGGLPAMQASLRPWLGGLFWWPLLAVLAMALIAGVTLRNHWGMQAIQFMCLPLTLWLCKSRNFRLRHYVLAAVVAHLVSMGVYALIQSRVTSFAHKDHRADTLYPAQKIADTALILWQAHTACRLRYVVGDFEAGLVAMYTGASAQVYVSRVATPWIDLAEMDRAGSIIVATSAQNVPNGYVDLTTLHLTRDGRPSEGSGELVMGVRPPQGSCDE